MCHISWRVCSILELIFSLMINLLSQHSVTEDILFSVLRLSFISLVLIPLKALSEWDGLNSDNLQLSTHLSIRSFISRLPVFSFLYMEKSHTGSYSFSAHRFINTQMFLFYLFFYYFATCLLLSVLLYPLPSTSHIYPS